MKLQGNFPSSLLTLIGKLFLTSRSSINFFVLSQHHPPSLKKTQLPYMVTLKAWFGSLSTLVLTELTPV